MASSKRQLILDQVATRLKTITTANGYETNMGSNVYDWKTDANPWCASELPGVTFRDIDEDAVNDLTKTHMMTMHLEIEAVVKISSTTGKEMRKALADIVKAVGTDPEWKVAGVPLGSQTIYKGSKAGILQGETTVAAVRVNFDINYRLNRFDPYTEAGQ